MLLPPLMPLLPLCGLRFLAGRSQLVEDLLNGPWPNVPWRWLWHLQPQLLHQGWDARFAVCALKGLLGLGHRPCS